MIKGKQWLGVLMLLLTITVNAQVSQEELMEAVMAKTDLPYLEKRVTSVFVGDNYVLLEVSGLSEDGATLVGAYYWGFDQQGNITKRKNLEKEWTNSNSSYISMYDANTFTVGTFKEYAPIYPDGEYNCRKFTNRKQIPFEVWDCDDDPMVRVVYYSVKQKSNVIVISKFVYGEKNREYHFYLNEKKNIERISMYNSDLNGEKNKKLTESIRYTYTYVY